MKRLKIFLIALMIVVTVMVFAACVNPDATPNGNNNGTDGSNGSVQDSNSNQTTTSGNNSNSDGTNKILVAYFSCTNNTKGRAQTLQSRLGADIYQITPAVPYTNADLNYNNNSSRANKEQNDSTCRPQISGSVNNISQYDVIYIGYPIWWGEAPKIIYTFLESYDLSGKTLIPFCTSASSPMGSSGSNLHASAPNSVWKDGCRVYSNDDIDTLVNMK